MTGATTWPTWVSSNWIASLVSAMTSPLNLICTRTPAGLVVMRCFGYFFQPGPLLAPMKLSCFASIFQIPSFPIPIVHFLLNPKNGPFRQTPPQSARPQASAGAPVDELLASTAIVAELPVENGKRVEAAQFSA